MVYTIRNRETGDVLAAGAAPEVVELEGNLYFPPDLVNGDALVVTDATYTCPYKGTCNWVDIRGGEARVGWVYPDPKPGFEQIRGAFGFYRGRRSGTEEG